MEYVSAGSIELTWDPVTRLARLRMSPGASGAQARTLIEALTRWIGPDAEPFGLLSDASEAGEGTFVWRVAWADFYKAHPEGVIAVFGAAPAVQVASALFADAVGVRLAMFADEEEALAWLRTMEIQAGPPEPPALGAGTPPVISV